MGQSQWKLTVSGNQLSVGFSNMSWNPKGWRPKSPKPTWRDLRGSQTRFEKNLQGPQAPLGGAQNAQLLAMANVDPRSSAREDLVCGAFCSFLFFPRSKELKVPTETNMPPGASVRLGSSDTQPGLEQNPEPIALVPVQAWLWSPWEA